MSGVEELLLAELVASLPKPGESAMAYLREMDRFDRRCTDFIVTHAPALLERIAALEGERDGLLREVTDYRRLLASFGGRTHNNTMSFDFRTNDRGELEMTGPHYGVDWRGWPSASDRAALDAARVGG